MGLTETAKIQRMQNKEENEYAKYNPASQGIAGDA